MPSSSLGQYDESLLKSAPVATREQLQEGYNPDLLVTPSRHKSIHQSQRTSTPAPPIPVVPTTVDLEHGSGFSPTADSPINEKARQVPFWRTRKGIIAIIVVAAIVIIAVVIGGAVGGTRKHQSSIGDSAGVGNNGTETNGAGAAPAPATEIPIETLPIASTSPVTDTVKGGGPTTTSSAPVSTPSNAAGNAGNPNGADTNIPPPPTSPQSNDDTRVITTSDGESVILLGAQRGSISKTSLRELARAARSVRVHHHVRDS